MMEIINLANLAGVAGQVSRAAGATLRARLVAEVGADYISSDFARDAANIVGATLTIDGVDLPTGLTSAGWQKVRQGLKSLSQANAKRRQALREGLLSLQSLQSLQTA